jgi:LysR family transcriptional regulator, hypochlorite-specific transcription factor HypT
LVADWLPRLLPKLHPGILKIQTRALAETVQMLEADEVHFMLTYFHPSLGLKLSARQFQFVTLADDELVPVSSCSIQAKPRHSLNQGLFLTYAKPLALRRLVDDHLAGLSVPPRLTPVIECDSADALLEYAIKGAGIAWLPWSMVASLCRRKQLVVLGDTSLRVPLQVRLYRRKRALSQGAERAWELLKQL